MLMPRPGPMLIKPELLGTRPKAIIVLQVPQVILMYSHFQTSAVHWWFPHCHMSQNSQENKLKVTPKLYLHSS